MKKKDGRGGARPNSGGARAGAGRPKNPRPVVPEATEAIDWKAVERFANVGAGEDEIVAGLGITEAQMKDPVTADRLRKVVTLGNAKKDLLLREQIDAQGKGEHKGGALTLALEARNRLGWDKQHEQQEQPPDLGSAHARLKLTLERLAATRSEALGRVVTPAELLMAEVVDLEATKH